MNLQKKLKNKEYRDSFAAEYIYSRIPLKIRAMRERRRLSQQELGRLAGVKQEWISKLEDPNYGRLTLSTLLRVASAFDVGLNVDFVPFSEIFERSTHLSDEDFDVASFDEENRPVPPEAAARGMDLYAAILAPVQKCSATPTIPLFSTNIARQLPTRTVTHNRGSAIFVVDKREVLSGNEQAPIVNELPAAARAAGAA
jgi:transcriptional regulator with XRE-family HTH domain